MTFGRQALGKRQELCEVLYPGKRFRRESTLLYDVVLEMGDILWRNEGFYKVPYVFFSPPEPVSVVQHDRENRRK